MLKRSDTLLTLIDVQGKLARIMHGSEALIENLRILVQGMCVLDIPIVWLEQYPQGLGPTVPEIAELLPDLQPVAKRSFSCCGVAEYMTALQTLGRKDVLMAGIETHICVYQTAMDLLSLHYGVHVVADCVSSRTEANKELALARIERAGGILTSTEMALFELLGVAQGEEFKTIARLVK